MEDSIVFFLGAMFGGTIAAVFLSLFIVNRH